MRKIIKKCGGSYGILFSPEDRRAYQIELGDIIEIEIKTVIKNE
jgi:hypothetical protein